MTPELERLMVEAAEREAIAGIPADILAQLTVAEAKFRAEGGCKGCGSMVLAAHKSGCPTLLDHDFY